jgi:hypothetical protein
MRRLPIGALALGQPYPPRGPGRWTAFWLPQLLTQSARGRQGRRAASRHLAIASQRLATLSGNSVSVQPSHLEVR